jgi:hypothetical protein
MRVLIVFAFVLFITTFQSHQNVPENMVFVEGNDQIKSFYMDKYEVTLAQYIKFQRETGYKTVTERQGYGTIINPFFATEKNVTPLHDIKGKPFPVDMYDKLPVTRITLEDALAYCKWADKRLPTKNEWMYAAKGGKHSKNYKYVGGNIHTRVGWSDANSREMLQPIGTKIANELGIYDLGGNSAELCLDDTDPNIIWRMGGSFFDDPDYFELRVIENGVYSTIEGSSKSGIPTFGFRCVKDY